MCPAGPLALPSQAPAACLTGCSAGVAAWGTGRGGLEGEDLAVARQPGGAAAAAPAGAGRRAGSCAGDVVLAAIDDGAVAGEGAGPVQGARQPRATPAKRAERRGGQTVPAMAGRSFTGRHLGTACMTGGAPFLAPGPEGPLPHWPPHFEQRASSTVVGACAAAHLQ